MNLKSFSEYEEQFSLISNEFESSWENVSRTLDELIASLQGIKEAVDAVHHIETTGDESTGEFEISLDGYESALEDTKTCITAADTEIDDHIKLCIDAQCILRELAGKADNALKNPQ